MFESRSRLAALFAAFHIAIVPALALQLFGSDNGAAQRGAASRGAASRTSASGAPAPSGSSPRTSASGAQTSSGAAIRSDGSKRFPGKGKYEDWIRANAKYDDAYRRWNERQYDQTIQLLHDAILIYPYDFAYYENLGAAYRQIKQFKSAEQALRKGIELDANHWGLWHNLGIVLVQQKQYRQGRDALMTAKRLNPPDYRVKEINHLLHAIDEYSRQ